MAHTSTAAAAAPEIDVRGLTWSELDELYPDLERRELHDGVLMMAPMPTRWHQEVALRVVEALRAWTREHGGVALIPLDVIASERRAYQPDVWLIRTEHVDRVPDDSGRLHDPPDLVVEVSSPSTRAFDLGDKRDAYAQFGIPEYWFVDLEAHAVAIHRSEGGAYPAPQVVPRSGAVTSSQLPGFSLALTELFEGVPHGRR